MGRSKENSKRKRSSRSKDSGHFGKRHNTTTVRYSVDSPKREIVSQAATDNSTKSFYNVSTFPQIPYYSWTLYFNGQEFKEDCQTVKNVDALIEFFEKHVPKSISLDPENRIDLDINSCFKDHALIREWSTIVRDLHTKPRYTLNCIHIAVFEVLMRRATADKSSRVNMVRRILQLNRVNMANYEFAVKPIPYVQLSSYGKLISIRCCVIDVGLPKLCSASVVYACKCGRQIIANERQRERPFVPTKCNVCGNGAFERLLDSPYQLSTFFQTINVKDFRPVEQMVDGGAISPKIIGVNLSSTFFDKFMPGDSINLIGIPRMTLGDGRSSTAGSSPLYIDATSIFRDDDISSIQVNENAIERIKAEPDVFSLLVYSLCPSVQGHEIIKAALILGLVGGSFENMQIRDSIHALIIGNLGLGKSQLVRACVQAAPRAIYIGGGSSMTLEPIMINVREAGKEDSRLKTGGFSLADRGVCCIDGLDKISTRHQVLSKLMDGQRIDVTNPELKFGVDVCTSVFGIIDPIGKRYDSSKTVAENVNANQRLLSQFHMVFLMRDHPDKYCDTLMCDRLLDAHAKRILLDERTPSSHNGLTRESSSCRDRDLREKLIERPISGILPEKLLRMYINCARSRGQPVISVKSETIIERFCAIRYEKDREHTKLERLFQNLVILIKARARVDLRDETTEQDVYDVVQILEHTVSHDTTDRPPSSSNKSNVLTRNKIKDFLEDLRIEAKLLGKSVFTTDELRDIAGKENVVGNSLSTLVSRLNDEGCLLKISPNSYKVYFPKK